MSSKTVIASIYGRDYTLACDTGQEQHLHALVAQVNGCAEQLMRGVGNGKMSEPLLLLYTALMLADELHDLKRENRTLKDDLARALRQINEQGDEARIAALEEGMAESLHALAARIEGLADQLTA